MFTAIDIDFIKEIGTDIKFDSLYVRILGRYSGKPKEFSYNFTIHRDVSHSDISDIIEILNPQVFNEIETEVSEKVSEYILETINDKYEE